MLPCKEIITANHTSNSCSKPKGTMMKGLGVNSIRRSGTKAAEIQCGWLERRELLNGSSDYSDNELLIEINVERYCKSSMINLLYLCCGCRN